MIDEKDDVSPDSLMQDFRGRGIVIIAVVAIVAHVVVFGATSIGFIKDSVLGPATDEMSQEEKLDAAFREATIAVRDVAQKYGVNPDEVSGRFSESGSRTNKIAGSDGGDDPADATPSEPTSPTPPTPPTGTDEPDKSDYEKSLETVAPPPEAPNLAAPITEEEDLF